MRHGVWDGVGGTFAVGYLASFVAGIEWATVAAFFAAVYSLLLILEKLYRWFKAHRNGNAK